MADDLLCFVKKCDMQALACLLRIYVWKQIKNYNNRNYECKTIIRSRVGVAQYC